jgi:hypothetical protein
MGALVVALGLAALASERHNASRPASARNGLAVRQVELFIRDNPAAPWRPAKQRGGLIFNNDCTVRIACELTVPARAPEQQIVQSVIVKKGDHRLVLLDRRRPAEVMRDHDAVKTVSTALFPCFQAAPAWLKRGEPVVVTVIVFLGTSEVSAAVNLIYDLAE